MLEKTLESPLDCKEIIPVNLEINPEHSVEGLMLKLQYWGHRMQRTDSLGWVMIPDAGKDWGQEEKGATEEETVR